MADTQNKAEAERRAIVCVDESGFYLPLAVVRTFAPQGQTPVLREHWTNDHLSAISGITPDGKLHMQVQQVPFQSPAVVAFLEYLHRHVGEKLLVVWDGAPIPRSNVIKAFLASGAAAWLQLGRLPGHAPESNPDEGVWYYLNGVELKNVVCRHLRHPRTELRQAKDRLRHNQQVLRACYTRAGV